MKIKVNPVNVPLTNETIEQVEIFDPRVLPARSGNPDAVPPMPDYLGSVSCIARFYDKLGNEILKPLRDDRTALTPAQFAAWDQSVKDDMPYFADCVIANLGLTKAA